LSKQLHRISNFRLFALTVTGQVNGDDARFVSECRKVCFPKRQIARPAVNKNQSFVAFAVILVMHLHLVELGVTVFGFGLSGLRSQRRRKRENQQNGA
jgi:hypothetical protein